MESGRARALRREVANQLTSIDTERGGELEDVMQRQVPPAALHLADEGPVQAGPGG